MELALVIILQVCVLIGMIIVGRVELSMSSLNDNFYRLRKNLEKIAAHIENKEKDNGPNGTRDTK